MRPRRSGPCGPGWTWSEGTSDGRDDPPAQPASPAARPTRRTGSDSRTHPASPPRSTRPPPPRLGGHAPCSQPPASLRPSPSSHSAPAHCCSPLAAIPHRCPRPPLRPRRRPGHPRPAWSPRSSLPACCSPAMPVSAAAGPAISRSMPTGVSGCCNAGRLMRVGDVGSLPGPSVGLDFADLTGSPDGALWSLAKGTVASFRDGAWTTAPAFPGDAPAKALEVLPDGTVWARSTTTLARLDGDAWTAYAIEDDQGQVPDYVYLFPGGLASTPDGSLWVSICDHTGNRSGRLLRFDGSRFQPVTPPPPQVSCYSPLASGPEGELWAFIGTDPPALARFDGMTWNVSDADADIPRIAASGGYAGQHDRGTRRAAVGCGVLRARTRARRLRRDDVDGRVHRHGGPRPDGAPAPGGTGRHDLALGQERLPRRRPAVAGRPRSRATAHAVHRPASALESSTRSPTALRLPGMPSRHSFRSCGPPVAASDGCMLVWLSCGSRLRLARCPWEAARLYSRMYANTASMANSRTASSGEPLTRLVSVRCSICLTSAAVVDDNTIRVKGGSAHQAAP